jgi:hypothetical protein
MRRVTVAGFAAVLVAALTSRAQAEVPGFVRNAEWVEVRSEHFRVLTDAGLGVARGTADKLERFADGLGRLNPGLAVTPATMATVIVLRDQSELDPFKPAGAENTDAFCQQGEDGERLVINGSSSNAGGVSPVLHECVHFLLAAHFPAVPLWLDEGLAEYYSTCRFHPETAEFGQPDLPTARWIKGHTPMGIEMMFAMNTETSAYRHDNETQFLFYSEAYLITHYLQSAGGSTTGRFDAYLAGLRRGARPLPAFREIFPDSVWIPIAAAVARYPDEIEFQRVRTVPAGTPAPGAERTLSHAEALTAIGDLELASHETTAAGEYYAAALVADPRWAPAMAGSGLVAEDLGHTAEADAAYRRALAAGGTNPVVLDAVARGRVWRIQARERAGAPVDSVARPAGPRALPARVADRRQRPGRAGRPGARPVHAGGRHGHRGGGRARTRRRRAPTAGRSGLRAGRAARTPGTHTRGGAAPPPSCRRDRDTRPGGAVHPSRRRAGERG